MPGNQSEGTIAIDPTNPARLFAASNLEQPRGLFAAFSTNGGSTWTSRVMADGSDGLPVACCDGQAAFDRFGNLFLTYLDVPNTNVVVAMSTNGGQTFATVTRQASFSDQPSIATGPGDLPGTGSVWVSYQDSNARISALGARVTGLGQVGTFTAPMVAPGSRDGNFGGIAVGPGGEVLVTFQTPSGDSGPSTIFVNRDLAGLAGSDFSRAFTVTTTNVGGFTFIPAQARRGIDAEANLAWDRSNGPHQGRVYLVFTDRSSTDSDRTEIFLTFSDTNGRVWSPPARVNDVRRNSHFLPAIAVDQTSGNVALTWYDARNDLGDFGPGDTNGRPNDDVQYWGTVSVDGGLTFMPNVQISAGTSNAEAANNLIDLGDYTSVDFNNGAFFAIWADNSNSTGDNPDGTLHQLDVYTAQVTVTGSLAPSGAGGVASLLASATDSSDAGTRGLDAIQGSNPCRQGKPLAGEPAAMDRFFATLAKTSERFSGTYLKTALHKTASLVVSDDLSF